MAAYDDLNVKRIFTVGIASVAVTVVTALAVQLLYYWLVQWQDSETRAESNYQRQNRILAQQQAEISTYGVDEETGNIVIPIDKAIELFVIEKSKKSSNASKSNASKSSNASKATDVSKTTEDGSDET